MAKKIYRADKTYLIEGNSGDNPKLMGRVLADGRDRLYLEFYQGKTEVTSKNGKTYLKNMRRHELLGLYLWRAPRTTEERQQNKQALDIAKRVRFERAQALKEDSDGYRIKRKAEVEFLSWMRSYYDSYSKADKRMIRHAYNCFVDFLIDPNGKDLPKPDWTREQRVEAAKKRAAREKGLKLKPRQITKDLVVRFTEYLKKRSKGEGAHSTYARFKKMVRAAVEGEVISKDPCAGITIKADINTLTKDVLSIEEVQQLVATHYEGENPETRRAFIFCLYTGLRWCDVKDLTFANVDYSNRLLKFEQAKTKGHSSASGVVIPLNDGLLQLIGKGERGERIFTLPSHTMCLKALSRWAKRAGIDKHITWHCARHSFAVNILNNGANIKTVASLLGHSGLKHTEKYTRAVDSLKEAAINSLPELKL